MKTALPKNALSAPQPLSAIPSRPTAHKACAQPSGARNTANSVLCQSRISALRTEFAAARPIRLVSAIIHSATDDAARLTAKSELQASVSRLLMRAESEEWSQRELARRVSIPESTFRKIRAGHVDALSWLPRIQTAAARLSLSPQLSTLNLSPSH